MPPNIARKVEQFFSKYPERHFDKGQVLVMAGEDPGYVFYLTRGHVRQYDISPSGEELVINVFKPPAFFPMSWAINKTPNQYFFGAATQVRLCQAPPDEVVAFLRNNPDVLFDLLSRVYIGTDGLLGRLTHLMAGGARNRLIFELILETKRFGKTLSDSEVKLEINEHELGARAGLARETVSREMHKLVAQRLVRMGHQGLVITDIKALERELGSDS